MIRDPFDSNNDRLSMSDALMGDPRAEMRFGRISSFNDESANSRKANPVSFGLIEYVFDSSIPRRRRARNIALWLVIVSMLFVVVSIGMTRLLT